MRAPEIFRYFVFLDPAATDIVYENFNYLNTTVLEIQIGDTRTDSQTG